MSEQITSLLELDLGSNGGFTAFHDLDDIEAWLTRERSFWQWFSSLANQDGNFGSIWNRLVQPIDTATARFQDARRQPPPDYGGLL